MFRLSAASRAKLMTQAAVAKMRRTHVSNLYPQPEGTLGEVLSKHGKDLGYDSGFGKIIELCVLFEAQMVVTYSVFFCWSPNM